MIPSLLRSDLEAVLKSIHKAIFSPQIDANGLNLDENVLEVFLNASTFSKQGEATAENSMSSADFRNWCSLLPSVRKFLGSLLMPPDSGSVQSLFFFFP